jgi:hypothetical protein
MKLNQFFDGGGGHPPALRRPYPVAAPLPPKAEPEALLSPLALANFESITADVREICQAATDKPLASAAEHAQLSELLAKGKQAEKGLEALRKAAVEPYNVKVKAVNGKFRPVTDALAAGIERGKVLLLAWTKKEQARIEREALEAQRRQEEAAKAEAEAAAAAEAAETPEQRGEALALAEAASERQMVAQVEAPRPAARGVRTDSGTSSLTSRWTHTVVRPELVPRQYLVVDEKAIRAAVAAGVRSIPGVSIHEEEGISIRTAR